MAWSGTSTLVEPLTGARLGGREGCRLKTEAGKDSPFGPRRALLVAKSKRSGL